MKTIDEATLEYVRNRELTATEKEIAIHSFITGAAFAQRWIPIEEELPETGEENSVKVKTNFGVVLIGYRKVDVRYPDKVIFFVPYGGSLFGSVDGDPINIHTVTHWSPIEIK
jgi:hypothetical protein